MNVAQPKHGCYNRPPFKEVVEWKGKPFPYSMSRDCQYSKLTDDVLCVGCNHKQKDASEKK